MTTLQTVIVERPPPGPARGKWEAPVWAIVLIAVSTVLVAGGYGLWRLLRARKSES
ncbi:MAG: hypothetical protein HY898_02200 [Deltaproteobacteria bacterium]|nr:hypothetical protein [Deltaproteobacteria bacterium]